VPSEPAPGQDAGAGRVVAATWLRFEGGAVLAVRPHGVSVFFLPGGVPEAGESYAQAAAREVAEEVGLRVDPAQLREVIRVEGQAYGRPGVRVLLICFEGPADGTIAVGQDEIAEVAWLKPADWHRFAPAVRTALTALT
jgi:ADP-ribose pyrophosphatase YjhB (NUDIX family)